MPHPFPDLSMAATRARHSPSPRTAARGLQHQAKPGHTPTAHGQMTTATRTAISTTCPLTAMIACPARPKTQQMVTRGPIHGIVSGSGPRMVGTTKQPVSRCTQAANSRGFPMTVCLSNAHLMRCTTATAGPMPRVTNGSTSAPAGGTSTTPRTTCCPSSTCPVARTALSAPRSIRLRATPM